VASSFGLDFFHLCSLMPFSPFPCLKTPCIFKSLRLAPWFYPKTAKTEWSEIGNRTVLFFQTCQIWSSTSFFYFPLSFSPGATNDEAGVSCEATLGLKPWLSFSSRALRRRSDVSRWATALWQHLGKPGSLDGRASQVTSSSEN
jgi:hypothetical protein